MRHPIRIISGADVERLVPMTACIELMRTTFAAVSDGRAELPLRMAVAAPGGRLGFMPGYLAEPGAIGVKVVSLYPAGASHAGFVLLFDSQTGAPLALISAGEITAIRTAAATAAATNVLANPDAGDLAILGAGVQAAAHLHALSLARPLSRVRLWARNPEKARDFAARHAATLPFSIEVSPTPQAAVEGATLVCATTSAPEPILEGAWLAVGAHVNLVGSSIPTTSEADSVTVTRARYFVDYRPSALAQAGELKRAIDQGLVGPDHIVAEVGEVLLGRAEGRRRADEITLFKSLGNAAQDLAAARFAYDRAVEAGVGATVEL